MDAASIREKIAALGKVMDDDVVAQTLALYARLLRQSPQPPCRLIEDIAYGSHARHRLDVYAPHAGARGSRPVVIYIHGGGFVGGDKNVVPGVVYANVGRFFAANGVVAVAANFRLPPESLWPAATDDIDLIVAWVLANAAAYGGDPGSIFLLGHSSGATHVATYALHRALNPRHRAACAGLILASGRFELPPEDPDPALIGNFGRAKIAQYYGADARHYAEQQVAGHVAAAPMPVFLLLAELDTFVFERSTVRLLWELMQVQGRMPWFRRLEGHNHMSEVLHLGTEDQSLGPHLLSFIRACTRSTG